MNDFAGEVKIQVRIEGRENSPLGRGK